ncbi:hypothetical protein A3D77_02080 [Candidatus Gottesmanbacteria bacterium RIFCSPHIGHO2_02_FULL_39_11]|uniref:DUF2795 domain-containing protein n=1 Tax=Candidatus Gottesmanbacteria bacterium RIFCSPHIGHO2_02_FULL_39_11 TaxID=1798382 RepID=A0A1F5ZUC7_9BACT|nr:MAG: hypothetical protein A3D77_02080 [Candidatus Gottesmanbacteria bacterium RIFCSPHIGHO2_02_FULL_39_11]
MKDIKNAIKHLSSHQKYPATKAELVAECDNLSDFSQEDKNWFKNHLAEGVYSSSDEVITALGLSGSGMSAGM